MPLTDPQKIHFEVKVHGTTLAQGGTVQNTVNLLYYQRQNFSAQFSASAFLTAFLAKVQTPWLAVTSEKWSMSKVAVRCINDVTEAAVEQNVALAGTITLDSYPDTVAMVISKRTALRGRSYMGRMYICGVPESGAAGNALTAGQKTLLDTLATKLKETVTDANGINFIPVLLSQLLSQIKDNPVTIHATQINNMIARSILGTCRSRHSKVTA